MQVVFTKDASKLYDHLPSSERKKINKKIEILKKQSIAGKKLTGEYEGMRSLRSWPYRIIYYVDTKQEKAVVLSVLHRQGAYK